MCGCCYSLLSDTSPAAGGGGEAVDNGEPGRDDTSSPLSLLGSVLC